MVRCAFKDCPNKWIVKGKNVKYHKFPKDPTLRQHWASYCDSEKALSRICEEHFDDSSYNQRDRMVLSKDKWKLAKGAVPQRTENLTVRESRLKTRRANNNRRELLSEAFLDNNRNTSMSCCVLSCWNFGPSSNRQDVTYHSFPVDPGLSRVWWGVTGRKLTNDFDPSGYTICSQHFSDSDWFEKDSQKILKTTAVPLQKVLNKPDYSLEVCRLCLTETDVLGDLFSHDLASKYIVKMLGRVLETKVEDFVNWPRKICIDCFNSIHKFGKFCQGMKHSQLTIKERYGDPERKIEKSVEFVDVNDGEFLMETSDDGREPVLEFREMYRVEQIDVPEEVQEVGVADTNSTTSSYTVNVGLNLPSKQKHPNLQSRKEIPAFQCELCDAKLSKRKYLSSHIRFNHPESRKEYHCNECKMAYYSKYAYEKHLLSHVPSTGDLQCESCDKKYSTPHLLLLHTRIEHTDKKNEVCHICGFATHYLDAHLKNHSNLSLRRKRCLRCGRCVRNLQKHACTLAMLNDPRECPICQKTFKNSIYLKSHFTRTHKADAKQFKCSICDKVFKRREVLKDHIASKHTKELQYKCTICDKEFCTYPTLYSHQKLKHKEEYELMRKKKFDVI